ncbi:PIG-L family deacetylase [Candidatus Woesearchaeota archaeon]|nr:PIG-L family deacetylase [Candidatus Woesearchaeota archaeon]
MEETVLVVVAHPDDQIFGPGGAIAKYAKEGKSVRTIIASYGEKSHPHFKQEVIRDIRVKESERADRLIGGKGIEYWGVREGKFASDFESMNLRERLIDVLETYKPVKIFTHARNETHPDHVAINSFVLSCYDEVAKNHEWFNPPVYTFTVWNYFRIKKRDVPRLIVDVSDTFRVKLAALSLFKSQIITMINLKWSVYLKAFVTGFRNNTSFAEEFYKVR